MKERPTNSTPVLRPAARRRGATRRPNEAAELRRKLADAETELAFYRKKHQWLQSALEVQRHARQMLEASVSATYHETVSRLREVVRSVVPPGSTVLVVSRGDQELLDLDGQRASHFPQNEAGGYAGYYPADSTAAISHAQRLIEKGAEYLLLPNTAFWWLEHYRGWAEWLGAFHSCAWRDECCAIYRLSRKDQPRPAPLSESRPVETCNPPDDEITTSSAAKTMCAGAAGGQTRTAHADILCFPVIDWNFRFQRPQQLMRQFARAGHRVFYLSHRFRKSGEPYQLRLLEASVREVSLCGPRFSTHDGLLDDIHCEALAKCLDALRSGCFADETVAIVQAPFWWPLAKRVSSQFGWPVVYDCMDFHAGFATSNPLLIEQEQELLKGANLVVASSSRLESAARRHNPHVMLVRNGCDYDHFARVTSKPNTSRPVIGYYGAIAEWFDSDLVAALALRRPDWDFILVGSTLSANVNCLAKLPNVMFTGEKPYAEIPGWLGKFDVTILPFKRTALTEATNPVKAYETFAAGKPLVSVPLPEVVALAPLARLASTAEEFEREIETELSQKGSLSERKRREFAAANTWQLRFEALAPAIQQLLVKSAPTPPIQLNFSYE
jgi:hypothetical protein